jgi:hypothetical protein
VLDNIHPPLLAGIVIFAATFEVLMASSMFATGLIRWGRRSRRCCHCLWSSSEMRLGPISDTLSR